MLYCFGYCIKEPSLSETRLEGSELKQRLCASWCCGLWRLNKRWARISPGLALQFPLPPSPPPRVLMLCVCRGERCGLYGAMHCFQVLICSDCPLFHPPHSSPLLTPLTSSHRIVSCIHAFTLWAESINISWRKKKKPSSVMSGEQGKGGMKTAEKQRSKTTW